MLCKVFKGLINCTVFKGLNCYLGAGSFTWYDSIHQMLPTLKLKRKTLSKLTSEKYTTLGRWLLQVRIYIAIFGHLWLTCSGDLLTFEMEEVRSETMLQFGICAGTEMVSDSGNSSTVVIH